MKIIKDMFFRHFIKKLVAITMNIVARKRRKRFVLDEQEDDETNELLNNGTFKMKEFTNNNSPLIAKFGEQILQGEFFYCIQNNLLLRLSEFYE